MELKITNVGIIATNAQKEAADYRTLFGLQTKQDSPEFVEFDSNGTTLFVWQRSHLERFLGREAMSLVTQPVMFVIQCKEPEQVDAYFRDLSEKGAHFIASPNDWPWKARAAYFVDRQGFIWEIYAWI